MPQQRFWIRNGVDWEGLTAAKNELAEQLIHRPFSDVHAQEKPAGRSGLRRFTQAVSPSPSQNVVGVGIGEKISQGRQTGILAIKFLVRMKFGQSEIRADHRLPEEMAGFLTDVDEVGILSCFLSDQTPNPRGQVYPVQPGCSIGFEDPNPDVKMAGTFGAVVSDDNGQYVLSNNHTMADENALALGTAIFQPGPIDNGDGPHTQIASLTRFQPLQATAKNIVDCAIAKVQNGVTVSSSILQIGTPQGYTQAELDMTVHKFGRTTGYTVGQVTSVNTDVTLQYEHGAFAFTGQILIAGSGGSAFSAAGDSGSLILDRQTNNAIGLLVGGSPTYTVANHIGDVLDVLDVTLA